jgi:hypothetical protein
MSLLGGKGRPYMLQRVTPMIFPKYSWGLDVPNGLPGVVAFRVPFPLDQILELSPPAMMAVVSNRLDFVLLPIIDKVRWGSREVLSILVRLFKRREERSVKHGVYGPLWGQAQLVNNRGHHLGDLEGSVPPRGKLGGPVRQGEVLCVQPYLLTLLPSRFFGVVALGGPVQGPSDQYSPFP